MPVPPDFNEIISAHHTKKSGFGRWFWLVFWTLFGLTGISEALFDWVGLSSEKFTGWLIGLTSAMFVGYLYVKLRKRLGLSGSGVRVLEGGAIELVRVTPAGNGGKAPLESITLTAGSKHQVSTVLVNVARISEFDWAVGHVAFMDENSKLIHSLPLTAQESIWTHSELYVANHGALGFFGERSVFDQLRAVSEQLRVLGKQMEMTFTESARNGMTGGLRFGLVGLVADTIETAIVTDKRQTQANSTLAEGAIPLQGEAQVAMAAVVREFNYKLIPNSDRSQFFGQGTGQLPEPTPEAELDVAP